MGTLRYETATFELDDRLLAHMQILVTTKLRRQEPFFLTWDMPSQQGSGRHTIWIDNGTPIHFHYYTTELDTDVNRTWLAELEAGTYMTLGTKLTPEPETAPAR